MRVDHPPVERLSELLDGDLSDDSVADVEGHLATCVACRGRLATLRALVERAASLPASIDPPPAAWTALRGRLAGDRSRVATRRPARWAREWGLRAAAVLVLVAGSSALTVLALRTRAPERDAGAAGSQVGSAVAVPASVAAVDRSYVAVVEELTQTLQAQRARLAPSTVATLERTLRVIDDAIAEARAALAADPGNAALLDVLSANYEQKVQLLRRASELPARS
jgi:anti-sigma factor RsiW